ncbi:CopD family protein [Micromonospora sp. RHAY321]|uniref:copper resistance D family protein n=1 Tax=Micromonospora sp. RHAY321 TaxID=2944807 RepID=UPI00207C4F65|nr:CopD family protein [Micromonospora sp. RHAY321]MCO1593991.1 CopD family protein [Micromonospora sp. RHAY321]
MALPLVALASLAMALLLGGGAPTPSPAGLPDPGPVTGWGLPVARLVFDAAAVATTGLLLLPALFLDRSSRATGTWSAALKAASTTAAVAAVAVAAQIILCASDVAGRPISGLSSADVVRFLTTLTQGWALAAQMVIAVGLAMSLAAAARRDGAGEWPALITSLVLVSLPALVGHSASTRNHTTAAMLLMAHVLGAAVWVGGLAALVWLARRAPEQLASAATRFSSMALGCAVLLGASGVIAGLLHAGWAGLTSSGYGLLLGAKAVAFTALVLCGWRHRQVTLPQLALNDAEPHRWRRPFVRLASTELLIMSLALGTAVALSRTPV